MTHGKSSKLFFFSLLLLVPILAGSTVPDGDRPARATVLPDSLISLGSEGTYAIFVDKNASQVHVYQNLEDGSVAKVKTFRTSTGQVDGNKSKEGDMKTPEGVYYIVRIREDSELLSKYGIRAFDLNYPNHIDKMENKTGYGIWLHGTDEPERLEEPRTSEGCVVVANEDIEELSSYITLYRTPVVISEKLNFVAVKSLKNQQSRFYNAVISWLDAWASQDFKEYSSYYSDSFKSGWRGVRSWLNRKKLVFNATTSARIDVTDLKLIRHGGKFVATFFQRYHSNLMDDTGIKWVYLVEEDNELKIVGEEWYPVGKALAGHHWNMQNPTLETVVDDLQDIAVESTGRLAITHPAISLPMKSAESAVRPKTGEQLTARAVEEVTERIESTVAVENLRIISTGDQNLEVEFDVVNKQQTGIARRGRIFVVAQWNSGQFTAFPDAQLNDGEPKRASRGDYYGIRWFKTVRARVPKPSSEARLEGFKAYIYDSNAMLIGQLWFAVDTLEVNK